MTLCYPTTHKLLFKPFSTPRTCTKPIVSVLHQDKNIAQLYSDLVDSKLDPNDIPTDLDELCQQISSSILESVDTICPKSTPTKTALPWEDSDLQKLMVKLRKNPQNFALQRGNLNEQTMKQFQIEVSWEAEHYFTSRGF